MKTMPSPYNFVAVEDEVAPAIEPETISHDTPFKEGLSGWIDIEIEATTPIYIRAAGDFKSYREGSGNHDSEFVQHCRQVFGNAARQLVEPPANLPDRFKAFTDFHRLPDGRPAIPGASLRGVLRNLLEMVTNSRLGPVNERRYAVRDLNNDDRTLYGGWMTEILDQGVYKPRVRAGWLKSDGEEWTITPCSFARVEQSTLGLCFGNPGLLGRRGSLESKYRAWSSAGGNVTMNWNIGSEQNYSHSRGKLRYRLAQPASTGGIFGTLVFTGQPMDRLAGKSGRKHQEFVFFDEKGSSVPVSAAARKAFEQTHSDEQGDPSEAWKFWGPKLAGGEKVPVFYLAYPSAAAAAPDKPTVSLDTPGAHLHAFGLAMMFRLAYRHTLREAVPASHREDRLAKDRFDFVESLFGYQRHEKADEGLRGRVSFGPCAAPKHATQLPPVVTVLSAPKPTYYPNYFEQPFDSENGRKLAPGKAYATLMDDDHQRRLRGWKFYPAHRDKSNPATVRHKAEPENDYHGGDAVPLPPKNSKGLRAYKTATAFRPLAAGTKFTGRLRFHNLRPAELGALVWALTWGDNDKLRHRIGMAKPLGYGCAKIRIVGGRVIPNDPAKAIAEWEHPGDTPFLLDQARDAFETLFANRLTSPAIQKDLLSMANPNHGHTLRYPTLDPRNEFADAKKPEARFVLPRWRVLDGNPAGNPRVDKKESPRPNTHGSGGSGGARHFYPAQQRETSRNRPSQSLPHQHSGPDRPQPPRDKEALPPPNPIKIGQILEGVLVLEPIGPGKPAPTRLYFQPEISPKHAGNTGVKIQNNIGAAPGQRWHAKVKSPSMPTFFELVKQTDHSTP